jgi:hypothetical protein
LTKLIKNNNNMLNHISVNFIDSDDYIELVNLFDELVKCKYNTIDECIDKIEKMIITSNGFQKYVLK